MPLLTRKAQIAVAVEAVEGTAETLAAADATMRIYEPAFDDGTEKFERNFASSTLSKRAGVTGKQTATLTWKTELKGSGSVATEPAFDAALRACGFSRLAVDTISIGAVTGGPFEPGETVTGGTSGATGRVVGEGKNGDAELAYVPLSGTFVDAETLTGGTSGATATSSSTPTSDQGFEYLPDSASANIPSVTAALYMDGVRKQIRGARGNVRIEAQNGEPAFLAFTLEGVYDAVVDAALLSVTFESTVPPAFLDVGASVHGLDAVFASLNVDMANTVAQRESANDAKGVLSYIISDRNPTATLDPEMALVASHDFYGRIRSNALARLYADVGDTAGNRVTIAAPRAEYMSVGEDDRDGIAVAGLEMSLRVEESGEDDELQIGVL